MMYAPTQFGIMLKESRENAHLSQFDLSAVLGKTAQYISNIEKGKNNSPPDDSDLRKLIEKLGLSPADAERFRLLAYADRGMLPPEIFSYVFENPSLLSLLSNAVKNETGDDFWFDTLKKLNRKGT